MGEEPAAELSSAPPLRKATGQHRELTTEGAQYAEQPRSALMDGVTPQCRGLPAGDLLRGGQMRRQDSVGRGYKLLGTIVATVVASYVVSQLVSSFVDPALGAFAVDATETFVIAASSTAVLWWGVIRPLGEQERGHHFDHRLQVALEMAPTEAATYEVVRRAAETAEFPGRVQLLLADSSKAHLKLAVERSDDDGVPGWSVVTPFDCPAVRRGQTSRFDSDQDLDACP